MSCHVPGTDEQNTTGRRIKRRRGNFFCYMLLAKEKGGWG
jgi:hypothetical protein